MSKRSKKSLHEKNKEVLSNDGCLSVPPFDYPDHVDFAASSLYSSSDQLTPAKYNGGQLDKGLKNPSPLSLVDQFYQSQNIHESTPLNYVVGVDWLELSLRGDLAFLNKAQNYSKKDFTFYKLDISTRHFNHSFNVYYRGSLFGTLLFGVRSAALPIELIQFKIDNQFFYKDNLAGKLSKTIKIFLDTLELTFNNYTRLDIYIDFHQFNQSLDFHSFVELYSKGHIETKGKITKWNPFYSKIDGKMNLTGFSMGSRSSEKFIRCYNKTLELQQSGKKYIADFWRLNGLDENKTVYRFELQLTGKFFNTLKVFRDFEPLEKFDRFYEGQSIEVLHKLLSINPSTIIGLFNVALHNYFDFFIQDHSITRNDDKLPFDVFNWHTLIERVKISYRFVKQRLRHKSFTWRQKMIVARNLFREYVISKQNPKWLENVARIVVDYQLDERWQKMLDGYVREFMQIIPYHYEFDFKKYDQHWLDAVMLLKKELTESTQLTMDVILSTSVVHKKHNSLYMQVTTPEQRVYYEQYVKNGRFDLPKFIAEIQNIL